MPQSLCFPRFRSSETAGQGMLHDLVGVLAQTCPISIPDGRVSLETSLLRSCPVGEPFPCILCMARVRRHDQINRSFFFFFSRACSEMEQSGRLERCIQTDGEGTTGREMGFVRSQGDGICICWGRVREPQILGQLRCQEKWV